MLSLKTWTLTSCAVPHHYHGYIMCSAPPLPWLYHVQCPTITMVTSCAVPHHYHGYMMCSAPPLPWLTWLRIGKDKGCPTSPEKTELWWQCCHQVFLPLPCAYIMYTDLTFFHPQWSNASGAAYKYKFVPIQLKVHACTQQSVQSLVQWLCSEHNYEKKCIFSSLLNFFKCSYPVG